MTPFPDSDYGGAYSGRRVLVTGGLGFIGSNLVGALAHLGAEVTVVDSLIPEYGGNLRNLEGMGGGRIRVNMSDVRDSDTLPHLVRDQEVLFNLAGQTSHMDSMTDPDTDLEINARAQLSILETCRLHNPEVRIVFASTRQIYGRPRYLPVDERHPLKPVDVNGINKLAGEGYHLVYSDVYGIRGTVLRLTNTIGPRMRVKDARQTFVGLWVRKILSGEPFEVWGGDQLRDFTYVDDAVEAFLRIAMADLLVGAGSCCVLVPRNADGPFYVEDGMCMACGAPEAQAGELMGHEESDGHCFFKRQPETPEEENRAILAVWSSCCGAVRYGGDDQILIQRLVNIGEADQCDHGPKGPHRPLTRTVGVFSFDANDLTERQAAHEILQVLRAGLLALPAAYNVKGPGLLGPARIYCTWYKDAPGIEVRAERAGLSSDEWLVRVDGGVPESLVSHAAILDEFLRADPRVAGIRWFTPYDWEGDRASATPLPY